MSLEGNHFFLIKLGSNVLCGMTRLTDVANRLCHFTLIAGQHVSILIMEENISSYKRLHYLNI